MRAYELYEDAFNAFGIKALGTDKLGKLLLTDTHKGKITLRHLNRLKKIRAIRRLEMLRKQRTVQTMYGDPDIKREAAELELEQEKREHELQKLKDEIALEIDKAKIDQETKDHIRQMANKDIQRRRKI